MNDKDKCAAGQPISLASLRRAFSEERLTAYAEPQDRDEIDTVARYLWNIALASALLPSLHIVEITLRNNLFNASRKVIDESKLRFVEVACWLDADPSLLYNAEVAAVRSAKEIVRRTKKPSHARALGLQSVLRILGQSVSESVRARASAGTCAVADRHEICFPFPSQGSPDSERGPFAIERSPRVQESSFSP